MVDGEGGVGGVGAKIHRVYQACWLGGGALSLDKRRCAPLIILPIIRCALNSESNVFTGRLLLEGRGTIGLVAPPEATPLLMPAHCVQCVRLRGGCTLPAQGCVGERAASRGAVQAHKQMERCCGWGGAVAGGRRRGH